MKGFYILLAFLVLTGNQKVFSANKVETKNLLLNPDFDFHSFVNHRNGIANSYSSHNVAFWNTDAWGDIEVVRESHVADSIRPAYSVHNMVAIKPGKKIWQFFTLPEASLSHGDYISLVIRGFQSNANTLHAKIKLMKIDSEDGSWSPKILGMKDDRLFTKHARGELVVAKEYIAKVNANGAIVLKIKNAEILGKLSSGNKSSSSDLNTIGIQIEIENADAKNSAWIYSPSLTTVRNASLPDISARDMTPYYRNIPRTIQKLWKGESIHIIVMGSSIDRGSANPSMYLYDEDITSKTFKYPLAEGLFDAVKAGRPELEGCFGQWRHFFSYAGRLKLELMRKFNLPANKICLNFMAADGSCIGEAHSGLAKYCNLSLEPDPELNGNKRGETWEKLYPELFTRAEGPRPDLVIFGSGANEKTDTPDEVAVFEGVIRWIQQHYPNTEFLFSQFQNQGGYTPNPGDLQALSLRYQIPFLDFGKVNDNITRWCNSFSLVPIDGHPQAVGHYLWFKQLEKIFECWDPILPGIAQLQLPERVHSNTYNWEGEMVSFDKPNNRFKGNRFIFEDAAINCWGKVDTLIPIPYIDGVKFQTRSSISKRDDRNSMFRFGRCTLGDRHILEITGKNPELTAVDAKVCPNRRFLPIDNIGWINSGLVIENFSSEWGAPYGSKQLILIPGKSIQIDVVCTDLSVAYVDRISGGKLNIFIDNQLKLSQQTDKVFIDTDEKENYLENRKGILNLGYGLHTIRLEAKEKSVAVLGIFTYDSRSNRNLERQLVGMANGEEVLEFSLPFKAKPMVICSGGLSVKPDNISKNSVKFSGTNGSYQIIGE